MLNIPSLCLLSLDKVKEKRNTLRVLLKIENNFLLKLLKNLSSHRFECRCIIHMQIGTTFIHISLKFIARGEFVTCRCFILIPDVSSSHIVFGDIAAIFHRKFNYYDYSSLDWKKIIIGENYVLVFSIIFDVSRPGERLQRT